MSARASPVFGPTDGSPPRWQDRWRATTWPTRQQTSGFTRRVGLYLNYPALGAELLQVNQSDPWVIAWSAEHHAAPDETSLPAPVADILRAADR